MRWLVLVLLICGCDGNDDVDDCPTPLRCSPPFDSSDFPAWSSRAAIGMGPRQEHSVVALGGKVYVLGGFDAAGDDVALVEAYDPATDTWETRGPMPLALHHLTATVHDGKIYVLGGLRGLSFTATGDSFVYDPGTNEWTPLATMPAGSERGGGIAATVGDDLVVVGGLRAFAAVADVSVFDPVAGTWSEGTPLPQALDHLSGGVVDGKLYVAGGRQANITSIRPETYEYEPGVAWHVRAPMLTPRGGTAGAVIGDALYVIGGEGAPTNQGVFAEVERFRPGSNTWESLAPMPMGRHGMGAAVVDGVIYVPGGGSVQAFGQVATHESFTPPP